MRTNDAHLRNNLSLGFVNVARRNNVALGLLNVAYRWRGASLTIGRRYTPLYIRPKRHIAVMVK
jgi:hypothetical protein